MGVEEEKEVPPVQNGLPDGKKEFVAPAVGMEFESYDDAYNYYHCYAKEAGFRVRVKNSWIKRNSREKYGALLCCSSEGFKRNKDVNRRCEETRTGCPAMIRMRVVDSIRWRVLEVMHEHNHLLGAKIYKSVKKMGSGAKSKLQSSSDAEVRSVNLYRPLVMMLRLTNRSFFYLMNFNDEGHLRNVFWVDSRCRAPCGYFGDVIYIDNTGL
ncbi:Protein FAR1-RELATED SEQUENCE 6 [Hibiscus syriacus]|uniref:Protein FAR1-RELATED SEQUENCE n=1 Tax=Hibiscus syriacus TaxID=106335 RepID=A0A6A2YN95_HIBSY|nr:Protein FAR1-RELATED SEQUENCE 6 [Hibiscus syriacus]